MCRVAYPAAQRQVLCLELHRDRQAQLVVSGLLVRPDLPDRQAPLVHRVFKALLALLGKWGLQVQLALLARQVHPPQFRVQQARPDLPDQQAQQVPQDQLERKAHRETSDLLAQQDLLARLGQPDPLGLQVHRASKVILARQVLPGLREQLALLAQPDPLDRQAPPDLKAFKVLRDLQDLRDLLVLQVQQGLRAIRAFRVSLDLLDPQGLPDLRGRQGRPDLPERKARQAQLARRVVRPTCSSMRQTLEPHLAIPVMAICCGRTLRKLAQHSSMSAI